MTNVFDPARYAIPGMMPQYPIIEPSSIKTSPDGGLRLLVHTRDASDPAPTLEARIETLSRHYVWRSNPGNFFEQSSNGQIRTLLFIDGLSEPLPVGIYTLWVRSGTCEKAQSLEVGETPWNRQIPCDNPMRFIVSDAINLTDGVTAAHVNYQVQLAAGPKEVLCKLVIEATGVAVPELVSIVQSTAFGFTASWTSPSNNYRLLWTTWTP